MSEPWDGRDRGLPVRLVWLLFAFISFFKLNPLGWHWLRRLHRLQSAHLYDTSSAYCIERPPPKVKSSSVTIYLTAFTLYHPRPRPRSHHTVVCVSVFLLVFLVCSLTTFSFMSHVNEIIWFLTFSDLFCLARYSQEPRTAKEDTTKKKGNPPNGRRYWQTTAPMRGYYGKYIKKSHNSIPNKETSAHF